ncbi:hypothetical protein CCACVL1_00643 [Corchorus capsularis]|uniref:Uncharacterized protein n=1 Tax=Corchorus capsularis TaxID=210143 RepID=A0A1R3KVQ2_COCAP|nr:hypothetical protein CCACVL1_00643 [Corchorus capsularis]
MAKSKDVRVTIIFGMYQLCSKRR